MEPWVARAGGGRPGTGRGGPPGGGSTLATATPVGRGGSRSAPRLRASSCCRRGVGRSAGGRGLAGGTAAYPGVVTTPADRRGDQDAGTAPRPERPVGGRPGRKGGGIHHVPRERGYAAGRHRSE